MNIPFFSDSNLGSVGLNINDTYNHLWRKTRLSFEHIYENYINEYDWFLKADDDTYVIVENLRYMLHHYSTDDPIYFGNQLQTSVPEYNLTQVEKKNSFLVAQNVSNSEPLIYTLAFMNRFTCLEAPDMY